MLRFIRLVNRFDASELVCLNDKQWAMIKPLICNNCSRRTVGSHYVTLRGGIRLTAANPLRKSFRQNAM
jgi:hypothetical protein